MILKILELLLHFLLLLLLFASSTSHNLEAVHCNSFILSTYLAFPVILATNERKFREIFLFFAYGMPLHIWFDAGVESHVTERR